LNNKSIFHLARHGQTEWNIEHRIQGQLDSPLTEKGQQQAWQLALICKPLHITKILTSPLGRAVQTATICAQLLNVDIKLVQGFEERHFGCWQGRLTSTVRVEKDYHEITSQITDCKPDQGESAKEALMRFEAALKQELERDNAQKIEHQYLMIVHGDLIRCFMDKLQQSKQTTTGYDYENGSIISIIYDHQLRLFTRL